MYFSFFLFATLALCFVLFLFHFSSLFVAYFAIHILYRQQPSSQLVGCSVARKCIWSSSLLSAVLSEYFDIWTDFMYMIIIFALFYSYIWTVIVYAMLYHTVLLQIVTGFRCCFVASRRWDNCLIYLNSIGQFLWYDCNFCMNCTQ